VLGQIVLGFALYPDLLASSGTAGVFWVVSLAAAGMGVAFMGMLAVIFSRRSDSPPVVGDFVVNPPLMRSR